MLTMIHDFNLIFKKNNIYIFPEIDMNAFFYSLYQQNSDTLLHEDNNQIIDRDIILLLACCNLNDFIKIIHHFDQESAYFFRVIMKANAIDFKQGDFYDVSQVFLNRLKFFQEYGNLELIFKSTKIPFIQSLIKEGNYNYQFLLSITFTQWLDLFDTHSIFKPLVKSIQEKFLLEQKMIIMNEEEIKIRKI